MYKLKLVLGIFLAMLFSWVGCAQTTPKVQSGSYNLMLKKLLDHSVPEVTVEQVTKTENPVFLDAREHKEYTISHIQEAVWTGYDDFQLSRVKDIPKDAPIIVYCSVGYRSEKVSEKLLKAGYTNVSNLYGGIFEWVNTGNPVYDKNEKQTQDVHAYNKTWGVWLNKGKKRYN